MLDGRGGLGPIGVFAASTRHLRQAAPATRLLLALNKIQRSFLAEQVLQSANQHFGFAQTHIETLRSTGPVW